MARIKTYPLDGRITPNDKVLGTDGDSLDATKNYAVSTFLDYLGSFYNLNSQDVYFTYNPVVSGSVGNGEISSNNYATVPAPMSGITNLYISKLSALGNLVDDFINAVAADELTFVIMDMSAPENYAVFAMTGSSDVDANTINLSGTVSESNGSLVSGRSIGLKLTAGGGNSITVENGFLSTSTINAGSANNDRLLDIMSDRNYHLLDPIGLTWTEQSQPNMNDLSGLGVGSAIYFLRNTSDGLDYIVHYDNAATSEKDLNLANCTVMGVRSSSSNFSEFFSLRTENEWIQCGTSTSYYYARVVSGSYSSIGTITNGMTFRSTYNRENLDVLSGQYVDFTSNQTISGSKTFSGGIGMNLSTIEGVGRVDFESASGTLPLVTQRIISNTFQIAPSGGLVLQYEDSSNQWQIGGNEIYHTGNLDLSGYVTLAGSQVITGFKIIDNTSLQLTESNLIHYDGAVTGYTMSEFFSGDTWRINPNDAGSALLYDFASDSWKIGVNNIAVSTDIPTVSDTAYDATTWNANTDAATKNAIRDKFESLPAVSDIAYDATTWNGNTDAATKNAIRDKFESLPAYATNTFTPTLEASTSGTYTTSSANGRYVKIGAMVHIEMLITCTGASSPVGNLLMGGLPFAVANNYAIFNAEVNGAGLSITSYYSIHAALATGETTKLWFKMQTGLDSQNDTILTAPTHGGGNTTIKVTGTYYTTE